MFNAHEGSDLLLLLFFHFFNVARAAIINNKNWPPLVKQTRSHNRFFSKSFYIVATFYFLREKTGEYLALPSKARTLCLDSL